MITQDFVLVAIVGTIGAWLGRILVRYRALQKKQTAAFGSSQVDAVSKKDE
ncbi:MAG TPA: hypothetical protein PLC52_05355 [Anaerolineales bacterium]|nr:hypothetical protein [Anaerolineales bacterium]HRQ92275.1 hypothetical protein [Anaerolineales bacterium]